MQDLYRLIAGRTEIRRSYALEALEDFLKEGRRIERWTEAGWMPVV